jgi:hypothetical protein
LIKGRDPQITTHGQQVIEGLAVTATDVQQVRLVRDHARKRRRFLGQIDEDGPVPASEAASPPHANKASDGGT